MCLHRERGHYLLVDRTEFDEAMILFGQELALCDWASLETLHGTDETPVLVVSDEDLPRLLELCSAHGLTVESTNRFAGFLIFDGKRVYELDVAGSRSLPSAPDARAAAAGLLAAWQMIWSGALEPGAFLPHRVRDLSWEWMLSGSIGGPPPRPTPEVETLAALLADAHGKPVDCASWSWPQVAVDHAGLLVPARLLSREDAPVTSV